MKNYILLISVLLVAYACSDRDLQVLDNESNVYPQNKNFERLKISDEYRLQELIESTNLAQTKGGVSLNFISLLDKTSLSKSGEQESISYYEALGYDTLVPNPNFARLLNPNGELELGSNIIKITPHGTFKYPISYESEFHDFMKNTSNFDVLNNDEDICKINDNITLFLTFKSLNDQYELIAEGDNVELPDNFFGEEDILSKTKAAAEPNITSFQTFSADKKTWVGKIIQNIIGSTKKSTVKFNKKRRVRGSFYFYNYGVYAEIGVQGWTDKKNWIGWSKTKADELRVGWNQVILKKTVPDYYQQSLKNLQGIVYYPPQYMDVNGQRVNIATLAMPDFEGGLKDRIMSEGVKAIYSYLRNNLHRPPTEWEKAQAFIVATRTELYYVASPQNVIRYNEKSYTHVFSKQWMEFEGGWSSSKGFFINGINQNNANQISSWINTIGKTFNEKKTTLIGGEVYICARFGNEWRGMRIIKK